MSEKKPAKILENNFSFFRTNVVTLIGLRPKIKMVFKNTHREMVQFQLEGEVIEDFDRYMENTNRLKAFNTAIVLNCFSMFEASYETLLLNELDTKNLSGIQEKVMLSYIEHILRLSSYDKYAKEYKFISGNHIRKLLSEEEYQLYQTIGKFYTLRHLLVHGSSSKAVIHVSGNGGQIELDTDDLEYQKLIDMLKKRLDIKVSPKRLTLDILLSINEVTDLLTLATLTISNKFLENSNYRLKVYHGEYPPRQ